MRLERVGNLFIQNKKVTQSSQSEVIVFEPAKEKVTAAIWLVVMGTPPICHALPMRNTCSGNQNTLYRTDYILPLSAGTHRSAWSEPFSPGSGTRWSYRQTQAGKVFAVAILALFSIAGCHFAWFSHLRHQTRLKRRIEDITCRTRLPYLHLYLFLSDAKISAWNITPRMHWDQFVQNREGMAV